MPILFTALEIPEPIQASIFGLRPKNLGINQAATPHITLHYIGMVNDHQSDLIQSSLLNVRALPYLQKIRGAGAFNPAKAPHVLWAGVNRCEELLKLHASVGQYLQEAGVNLDTRRYSPHITVARIKQTNKALVESYINKHRNFSAHFDVTGFSLFSSERSQLGAIYNRLQSYHF